VSLWRAANFAPPFFDKSSSDDVECARMKRVGGNPATITASKKQNKHKHKHNSPQSNSNHVVPGCITEIVVAGSATRASSLG
jgi:hypothetical protein